MSESGITYHSMLSICGKPNCRTCKEKGGHGPYWYAYQTTDGRTKRTYLGKNPPPAVLASEVSSSPPSGRVHTNAFIGREVERERLHSLLQKLKQGSGSQEKHARKTPPIPLSRQCALVLGEAGIGKTRLAEEISQEAQHTGWRVLWGRAYAQEVGIPYHLWTDMIRRGLIASPSLTTTMISCLSNSPHVKQQLLPLLPELQTFVPTLPLPAETVDEQGQVRRWEAFRELFTAISKEQPLLIVLDDLQWADSSSCDLFAYLARRIQGTPLALMGTYRDHELPWEHPLRPLFIDLQREGVLEQLPLLPLSDEQIGTLVSATTPLTQPAVQTIQRQAGGNPFFAEELARMSSGQLELRHLPGRITDLLDLRLKQLSKECQHILSRAAIFGGSFEFSVICAMQANNEEMVLDALEEALQSGLLIEEEIESGVRYSFWHPLLVSHLYEHLSVARRAQLHRKAATILQNLSQEDDQAAAISYHLERGNADSQGIAEYAERAAHYAYRLAAYPDAEQQYVRALGHLHLGDSRRIRSQEEQQRVAYLLECCGECGRIQGKYREARSYYERALHTRSGHAPIPISGEEVQIQALLLVEIGVTYYDTGDNEQAFQQYQAGERMLQQAGVLAGPAWARLTYEQAYVYWRQGNYEQAQQSAQKALHLFQQTGEHQPSQRQYAQTRLRRTIAGDAVDIGRTYALLGIIASSTGALDDAIIFLSKAQDLYAQYECLRERAIVCCNLGDLYLRRAEHEQARTALLHAQLLAERIGEGPLLSYAIGNLGLLYLRQEQFLEADQAFLHAVAVAVQVQDVIAESLWMIYRTRVLQAQGKLPDAEAILLRACSVSREIRPFPYKASFLIALSSLRLAQAREIHDVQRRSLLLRRASSHLHKLLLLDGLETIEQTEGMLLLAQVELLQKQHEAAH